MKFLSLPQIVVSDYQPQWAVEFLALKTHLSAALSALVGIVDIEHVGSTAVVGLAAKPVLDIDIVLAENADFEAVAKVLTALGYTHRGDFGIADREVFGRQLATTPSTESGRIWQLHNLYVCAADAPSLRNHKALRDYLRSNSQKAAEYGALKKELARQYQHDIGGYVRQKTAFIIDILRQTGFDEPTLAEIARANGC
jgi:GrpB-like predicted nucleotidyltransferase (UPF0157 family)